VVEWTLLVFCRISNTLYSFIPQSALGQVHSLFQSQFSTDCYLFQFPVTFLFLTDYGLDGPGSNHGGGRDFPPVQTGPGAHPASCKMGTGSFPGVNCGRGVLLTTNPILVPRSWKSRAIPLPTLWATPDL